MKQRPDIRSVLTTLKSYFNKGSFKTKQNELIRYDWMESVYMVLDGGELKLKFLQSDLVSEVTEQLGQ